MPYEKSFSDALGGTQTIRTVGSTVMIEGPIGDGTNSTSLSFDAKEFRSAELTEGNGGVAVHTEFNTADCMFLAPRGLGFGMADLLEAVSAARAEG